MDLLFENGTKVNEPHTPLRQANMKLSRAECDVAIVGAGPYGLSTAGYLRKAGVETRVFGDPMSFWRDHMPAGMFLRSNWGASHIADPNKQFTLDSYRMATGNHLSA